MPDPITVTPHSPIDEPFAEAFQRTVNRIHLESLERFAKHWWREFLGEPYRTDSLQRHGPRLSKDIEEA